MSKKGKRTNGEAIAHALVGVEGVLNRLHAPLDDAAAPVIIAGDAAPAALLGWAMGQFRALQALLAAGEQAEETAQFAAAASTLAEQIGLVLGAAVERLPR